VPAANRLGFLDFVRGIAAFAVLVQHTSENLWPSINWATHQYVNLGRFGVVAFFLVSGFIIPFSLERGGSVRRFWIGRFFRLYPLYWLSLGAILVIYQFRHDALTADFQTHTLLHAVVNFTMIQELVGVPHAIGLYYTLTVELVFYTLCALLFAAGLLSRSVRNAWVVLGASVVLATVAPLAVGHRAPMAGLFYVPSMFIGTVVYRYSTGHARLVDVQALIAAVAVFGVIGCYVNYVHFTDLNDSDPFTFWGATIAWSVAYLFFFGAFAMRREQFPEPFLWLGRISYSLYLMHPLVVVLVVHWTQRPLALLVVMVVSLLLADATFRFVELPFQELGRRVQGRVAGSLAPASTAGPSGGRLA
jgi:peptidoglycan/LPS O-acetylase OafA/YrhL